MSYNLLNENIILTHFSSVLRSIKKPVICFAVVSIFSDTTEKMKFSIKDFSVNVTESAGNCGFGQIY